MTTQKRGHEWRFSIVLIALMVTAFMLVSSAAAADAGPKFKGWNGEKPPVANLSIVNTSDSTSWTGAGYQYLIDQGTALNFTNVSYTNVTSLSWVLKKGTEQKGTSTSNSFVYTFGEAGNYTIELYVTNATGTADIISGFLPNETTTYRIPYIQVAPSSGAVADFKVDGTTTYSTSVNKPTWFNATVAGYASYSWNMGDGTIKTGQNVSHTYTIAGDKQVKLDVVDQYGGTATVTKTVTVTGQEIPVAKFTNSTTNGVILSGQTVTFTDKSTNQPTEWLWNFTSKEGVAGINTSTLQNPTFTFQGAGQYNVTLWAKNAVGWSVWTPESSHDITVLGPETPTANFTATNATTVTPILGKAAQPYNGLSVPVGDTIQFNESTMLVDNVVQGAQKAAASYTWDFGDGSATSALPNVTHKYTTVGNRLVQFTASNSAGHSSYFVWINVTELSNPVANFKVNDTLDDADTAVSLGDIVTHYQAGKTLYFNSTSTGSPDTFSWTFQGDAQTYTGSNVTKKFDAAGRYLVRLDVSRGSITSQILTFINIDAVAGKQADFTVDGVDVNQGDTKTYDVPKTVKFNATPDDGTYSWYISDGPVTKTDRNITHTFGTPGTFNVILTYTNTASQTSVQTISVVINPPVGAPIVDFSASPASGTDVAPVTVQFTDKSSANVSTYAWTFGTGPTATSNLKDPTYTYQQAGNYTVRLTVATANGLTNTTTQWYNVSAASKPDAAFTVADVTDETTKKTVDATGIFTYDTELRGAMPFSVNFTDISKYRPTSWAWRITGTGVDQTQNTKTFNYTFNAPGKYNVQLSVANPTGTDFIYATTLINVTAAKPKADFTWTPTTVIAGQPVQFTDTSLYGPTVWSWSFIDGTADTSALQNPSHTFAQAGTYKVRLQVMNAQGTDFIEKTVIVTSLAPPVANFTYSPENPKVGDLVTFTDTSTNNPTIWYWGIDGVPYTTQNPTVTFTTAGEKPVFLVAVNAAGSSVPPKMVTINVTALPVTITPTPEVPIVADFTMDQASGVAPLPVQFVSTSTGPYTSLDWTILLGEDVVDTMVGETPSFTFANPGTYTVLLEASNSGTGEVATKEKTVTVTATPTTTVTTTVTTTAIGGNQPFPSAHVMPGRVEAEDYDITAGYPAYSDTTAANEGGAYRQDAVDIEVGGSNYNVGWIRPTEFLTYSVDVPTGAAGAYTIAFRMANPSGAKSFNVFVDGVSVGTVNLPATGSFNTYTTVTSASFQMTEGRHVIKVDFPATTSINFDYMQIQGGTPVTTTTTVVTTTTTAQPTTGGATFTAAPIPVKKGAAIKFTVTPAAGKTIKSAWWTFDKAGHYNTWNSRTINPTFYYPAVGTYTPLVILTYTDGTTQTVEKAGYARVIA